MEDNQYYINGTQNMEDKSSEEINIGSGVGVGGGG